MKEGWEVVLSVIEKVISSSSDASNYTGEVLERVEQAFRCIELLIHNSLHKIDLSNIGYLINVIHHFASLRGDLNISLVAVGLIRNVADYIGQQHLNPSNESSINEIWLNLVKRLKEVGYDERGELRQASYRTLEKILIDHAGNIPLKIWSYTLLETFSELLQYVKVQYFMCVRGNETPTSSESTSSNKQAKKKEEKKAQKDPEEIRILTKSWEESVTVLFSLLVRVLKRFSSIEGDNAM